MRAGSSGPCPPDAKVLNLQVHPLDHAVRDGLIVSHPKHVTERQLMTAV